MRVIVALIVVMLIAGCIGSSTKTEAPKSIEETTPIATETIKTEVPISIEEKTPVTTEIIEGGTDKMTENPTAVILTNKGEFRFELYAKRAPITVTNFVDLAESGFYDGLTFHRYEPGFVIQGGDPRGDGTGGSDKKITLEIHPELTHVEGTLAMARSQDPNSASSQFYVTLAPAHFLDANYAVFGKVAEGMDVVLSLRAGDKMEKVSIEK
ncbi:MAG: peptidylprolyl isomerase [Candidatus Hydrothermarchaeales archaeon]